MELHSRYDEFFQRIADLAHAFLSPWSGTVYRCAERDFCTLPELANGEGARRRGGRLNAVGLFGAVYVSCDSVTAVEEALRWYLDEGFDRGDLLDARETMALEVTFDHVLDLRDEDVRAELLIEDAMLEVDWEDEQNAGREAVSQALGRALRDAGIQAVLLPSRRCLGGVNLVFFPDNAPPDVHIGQVQLAL